VEDCLALAVFTVNHGVKSCNVGYFSQHLAARADRYDGLIAIISKMVGRDCDNATKRFKWAHHIGCRKAAIIGMRNNFV
jgi:hypothetical protein